MVKKKIYQIKNLKMLWFSTPKWAHWFLLPIFIFLIFSAYNFFFWNKIFPGIYVAGVSIGGKTLKEAETILSQATLPPKEISLTYQDQVFNIPTQDLGVVTDYQESVEGAYNFDRQGNLISSLYQRALAPVRKVYLGLVINLDEEFLDNTLGVIAEEISQDPVYPSAKLVQGEVMVDRGTPGSILDSKAAKDTIKENLSFSKKETIYLTVKNIDPTINEAEAENLKTRAESLLGKKLILTSPQEVFEWKEVKIFETLDPLGGYKKEAIASEVSKIASSLNREPQNPTFIFEEGRVKEFAPAEDGLKVRQEKLVEEILEALLNLERQEESELTLEIPLERTPPKISTGDVNNLGIKELIGKGSSNFRGSIANRVYNIGHASSKFKGILIPPGQVFSFNEALGDVSSLTGYKQAFVIKDGKTVLGDGGGVCQVSSTFFRAALAAGLPIVERRAHSYRVSYYEQGYPPGLDATVYAPTTDLKVLNDTPGHILIQPIFDPKAMTLNFEFYGTSDGRVAKTTKPVVTGVTPPPEDLYVDDPTLPAGQIKQIDFKAWGAKVTFDYTVERGGEVIYEKTFLSNFRPWQAVFLRGVGPTP
ncbi:hypothetical protein A2985_04490 [Candidatus Woesebacteria bacterium RIFCSPLOWO2_01_FULL_43_11]|uniref:YoaR-like putative peptidoglycan binding domain-containing protein n=1 Tax=Candidatus Woesebacteria bacterium RBG_16_42_24 TaxID=1802485 RepID=A0A1F7XLC4_9BACT|nr:MAG: hypothetical protein A2V97_03595 [Candidatus Woesebacteria bacterium RBG_16_42_24]OGM68262.1 MAG: hypothetical protein A2985_04490 [Candidatus Woesebacteria bacterium RIFCSPLOWO2_01_FULL_43_11]